MVDQAEQSLEAAFVDDEHPWPGLASFREQDEHFFKGRNQDVEKLSALVNRERLTVLFGVSGLGKSSLLQAGLFPQLRQEGILPIIIRLDFTDISLTFKEQVFAAIFRQAQDKHIESPGHRNNETLWEYFHRKDAEFWDARNRITLPLLCFDQFEEVFTLGREDLSRGTDLKKFLIELADLVEGRCPECVKTRVDASPDQSKNFNFSIHPYKLLISLREDYLADMEGLRSLMPSIINNRMRLLHMNGKQAMAVADQTQGRLMEHSVAETVVRMVAGKHGEENQDLLELRIEPALLSLVCRELNERRIAVQASQIDAQSVASNREQILENFIDRSLSNHKPELRRFIEDKLITVSGYRNSEAYDNAIGIFGVDAEALDSLVECRVFRLEERDGIKRIELIHDVLTGVIRKSRDQRQILEKQRQAEQDRLEAEKREQKAREALKISKRRGLAFLILTVIALASSGWGWWSWWNAQEAHIKARHALAMADFREGKQHYEAGNTTEALAHLAHAIRLDPEWMSSRALLVNLLQQRSWFFPLAIFKYKDRLNSVAFSPDGTKIVTASADNSARLWDANTGKPLAEAMTHKGKIASAQFSPDGLKVVTASWDKSARLWDAKTGKPFGKPILHQDIVYSAQFSPDGTRILTASGNNAHLWDVNTNKLINDPILHQGIVYSAQFSPDGTRVVTASNDNTARIWDAHTGKPISVPMLHQGPVYSAVFSADGRRIVTAAKDKTAKVWDAITATPLGEAMHHEDDVYSARFSPDGTEVVTASKDNSARLWDTKSGKPLGEALWHDDAVIFAKFSPNGKQIVTASWDKSVRLWDAKFGKSVSEVLIHEDTVNSAKFSPDGTKVVTASKDNTARLWDANTSKLLGEAMKHRGEVYSAEFSPDGNRVVTASKDNSTRLWDPNTGAPLGDPIIHSGSVYSAHFSPDGAKIITTSIDNSARLWDSNTRMLIGNPMTHQAFVNSTQFSPDSTKIVIASENSARLWDANTGKPLGKTFIHQNTVVSARFSLDGSKMATASKDNSARLWDPNTGNSQGEAMMHQDIVYSARFSPDGTRVVTASKDKSARLWGSANGKPLGESIWHSDDIKSVGFSPNGLMIVTGSDDKTVRIWDANTGKPLSDFMKYENRVNSAEFNKEGTRIVAASEDHTARIWDVFPVLTDENNILPKLAEAVTGYRLTELSAIEPLENQLELLNQLRQQTENTPLGKPTAESFSRWFLSNPWTRTISPLSSQTVPEFIQQQIEAGRRSQMEKEFPGHPLLK